MQELVRVRFSAGDIMKPDLIGNQISQQGNEVSRFLWNQFSDPARQLLSSFDRNNPDVKN